MRLLVLLTLAGCLHCARNPSYLAVEGSDGTSPDRAWVVVDGVEHDLTCDGITCTWDFESEGTPSTTTLDDLDALWIVVDGVETELDLTSAQESDPGECGAPWHYVVTYSG